MLVQVHDTVTQDNLYITEWSPHMSTVTICRYEELL